MEHPLHILILEDSPLDAALTLHALRKQIGAFEHDLAASKPEYIEALKKHPDLILADYALPQFNALLALELLHETGWDIPFIIISGTIGEDIAVEAMRAGAYDYLMKDRMARLGQSIEHAVSDAEMSEENRKAQQIIKENESRYHSLFEDSPISLWEEDFTKGKHYITELRQKGVVDFEEYFSIYPDEIIKLVKLIDIVDVNRTTIDLYHARDKTQFFSSLSRTFTDLALLEFKQLLLSLISGKTHFSCETIHNTFDHQKIYISLNVAIAPGYENTWEKVFVSIMDITERKQAEEKVLQSERLLRTIIDSSPDWIFLKDRDHRYLLANQIFANSVDLTQEEIIGKNDEELGFSPHTIHGDPHSNFVGFLSNDDFVLENNEALKNYGVEISHTNGKSWFFDSVKVPMTDPQGQENIILGISRDITDRLKIEKALQTSEERFRYLYQAIPDGIFILDEEGIIQEINTIMCDWLGYAENELIGKSSNQFQKDLPSPELTKKRLEILAEEGFVNFIAHAATKDGQRLELDLTTSKIIFEGKPALMNIARDITTRVIAQEILRENEELLKQIIDSNPSLIWVTDEDGRYVMVNETTARLFQLHPEEVIGLTNLDLAKQHRISKEAAKRFHFNNLQAVKTGSSLYISEQRFTDIDGVAHWLQTRLIPLEQTWGGKMILGVAIDITEQRQSRQALLESEEMLRAIMDNAPNQIFVVDDQDRYVLANKSSAEALGVTPEDLIGKTPLELAQTIPLLAEYGEHFLINDMEVIRTQQPKFIEERSHLDRDGNRVYLQIRSLPLNREGRTPMMLGVASDITEKTVAAQQLAAANETLEQRVKERTQDLAQTTRKLELAKEQIEIILNSSPDGFCLLDKHTDILIVNPAFCQMTGLSTEQLTGHPFMKLAVDNLREEMQSKLDEFLAHKERMYYEYQYKTPDKTLEDRAVTLSPVFQDQEFIGIVVSIRDISQMKEVQRMKDAFVSNVSHELRTPITNFIFTLELLRRKPEQQELYLKRLDREVEQLRILIENLLLLSRLDQDAIQLKKCPVDLNDLCAEITLMRSPLINQKGLSLQFIPGKSLPNALADFGLINQILSILLTNAMNYTPKGGKIVIRTYPGEGLRKNYVGFSVSNNGPGIQPDDHQRIFERFYRGEAGLQSGVAGTGLGLAIAQEIIWRHQGEIELDSSGIHGEGVTFFVWLPVDKKEAANII
ncbi:MAG: PAS domain S-box protein [Anaerolineaceae bacterium]|nr:PAS domain S-box protein [Anaerolineaceae bacterium]